MATFQSRFNPDLRRTSHRAGLLSTSALVPHPLGLGTEPMRGVRFKGAAAMIIPAIVVGVLTGGTGIPALGLAAGWTAGAIGFAASVALSLVSSALAPKPKQPNFGNFADLAQGRQQSLRQAITSHKMAFGDIPKLGGALTFYEKAGGKHHMVVTLAAHKVQAIKTIWLGSIPIYDSEIDGSGNVIAGKFSGKVRIKKHLGDPDQAADSDLVAETSAGSDFRQRGRAYIYVRIAWDQTTWPNGLPNIAARVLGALVEDPRLTGDAAYSFNAALVLRHWMRIDKKKGGLGVSAARMDEDYAAAAANICDEFVPTIPVSSSASAVSASDDMISLPEDRCPFQTGDRIELTTTGTEPGGLIATGSPQRAYYAIVEQENKSDTQAVKIRLADSYSDAQAGTYINITSAGTGILTLTKVAEPRYVACGVLDTARQRGDNLRDLSTALGRIPVDAGGKWRILAAAWSAPSVTLDESHLRGSISGTTRISHRDRFNGIKGLYASPQNDGVLTDYPAVTPSAYLTADNSESMLFNLDLPFTPRSQMAQRLAMLTLRRHRNELSYRLPCKLHAYQVQAGETVAITNARRGWSAKNFEVEEATLLVENDGNGNPTFGCDLKVKSSDSTDYDFDYLSEEQEVSLPANASSPWLSATAPNSITLASGTEHLFLKADGTVVSRLYYTISGPDDGSAEWIVPQVKKSSDSVWRPLPPLRAEIGSPNSVSDYVWDVEDGVSYQMRAQSISQIGVQSDFTVSSAHTVVGKTQVPAAVSGFAVQQNGAQITIRCDPNTEADNDYIAVRRNAAGDTNFADAIPVANILRGLAFSTGAVPPGDWTFLAKAIDRSGNESAAAARYDLEVTNALDIIESQEQWPLWSGLKRHWVAVSHYDAPYLTLYNLGAENLIRATEPPLSAKDTGKSIAISPEGDLLVVGSFHVGGDNIAVYSIVGSSALDVILTDIPGHGIQPFNDTATSLAFSPDGSKLAVAMANVSPYVAIYTRSGTTFTKINDPSDLPTGYATSVAWSPDGSMLAVGHNVSPYLTVYSVVGETFTKLSDPATLPPAQVNGVAFSSDNALLSTAHFNSPYLSVYSIDGVNLTKLSDPVSLPAGTGASVAFAPGGVLLAIGSRDASPYLAFYDVAGGILTKRSDPADLPGSNIEGLAFSISDSPLDGSAYSGRCHLAAASSETPGLHVYSVDGSTIIKIANPSQGLYGDLASALGVAIHFITPTFVRNPLTGNLNPESLADLSANDFAVFDSYVDNPVTEAIYEAPEIDISVDVNPARIWADVQANAGPGETGDASAGLEVDYRVSAGAYDGFDPWTVGDAALRYAVARIVSDTSSAATRLTGFNFVVDAAERSESGTVTFALGSPTVAVFAMSRAVTTNGFSIDLYEIGGALVGTSAVTFGAAYALTPEVIVSADANGTVTWRSSGV